MSSILPNTYHNKNYSNGNIQGLLELHNGAFRLLNNVSRKYKGVESLFITYRLSLRFFELLYNNKKDKDGGHYLKNSFFIPSFFIPSFFIPSFFIHSFFNHSFLKNSFSKRSLKSSECGSVSVNSLSFASKKYTSKKNTNAKCANKRCSKSVILANKKNFSNSNHFEFNPNDFKKLDFDLTTIRDFEIFDLKAFRDLFEQIEAYLSNPIEFYSLKASKKLKNISEKASQTSKRANND